MNELKNELRIELSCGRCGLTVTTLVNLDEDGVFTIPNKFCPNDLSELSREVLHNFVSVPKKPESKLPEPLINKLTPLLKEDEPTEDKTRVSNPLPRPTRILDVSKHGAGNPKKA